MTGDAASFNGNWGSGAKGRSLDELIGICKGVVADGKVCQAEADFLLNWMQANRGLAAAFPASALLPRLTVMLAGGRLDDAEAQELLGVLRDMTGEQGQQGRGACTTSIAFDDPLPRLGFAGRAYCLTGGFVSCTRAEAAARIEALGGRMVRAVTTSCTLIVGCVASDAWLHSTHGRKILCAVEERERGKAVRIIPEAHWFNEVLRVEAGGEEVAAVDAVQRTQARQAARDLYRDGGKVAPPPRKPEPEPEPVDLDSLTAVWSGEAVLDFTAAGCRVEGFALRGAFQSPAGDVYLYGAERGGAESVLIPFVAITSKVIVNGQGMQRKTMLRMLSVVE